MTTATVPPFIVSFGMGNSGREPAKRCVNRTEFNEGGHGWPQFTDTHLLPAIGLGATVIQIPNPAGEVPGPMQAEAFREAERAGLPLLADTRAFVRAVRATRDAGASVIVYMGGVGGSRYIKGGSTHRERLRRARECYQPIFDSGAALALDGDAVLPTNSDDSEIVDALAEFQPDPTVPQYVEALWGARSRWCWDRPCIIFDSTYRIWKRLGFSGLGFTDAPTRQGVRLHRIIDSFDVNDPAAMLADGPKAAQAIYDDGHGVIVNGDTFIDGRVRFDVVKPAG